MALYSAPTLYVRERLVLSLLLGLIVFIGLVTGEARYPDYPREEGSVESPVKKGKKRPSLEKSVKKEE